ncbi:MAG: HAD family phosphatase [Oscillospiraceae bacterium]|jgi:Cof subfamily protein (haloacid dehalogenase superfamily)|nr:HAD family phosphatase [Oscillospiraceae bacterium]
MRPKLILTDLDGTLLREDKHLSPANRAALEQASAQGAEIVVSTGRLYTGIPQELRDLPFLRYFILMNGAKVYDRQTGQTLGRAEIPWATADAVIDFLEPLNCSVDCFQNDRGMMAQKYYDHLEQYVTHPPSFNLVKQTRSPVDDLKNAVLAGGGSVQKFHAYFPDLTLRPKVMEQIQHEFPTLVQSISMPANLELNAQDATKGNGLLTLCRCLGIDPKETAAFGDGTNDISMLAAAGVGVSMANGAPETLAAADLIAPSNEEDGVAQILSRWFPNRT